MNQLPGILIIDHESNTLGVLQAAFGNQARILRAHSVPEAEELLGSHAVNVLICRDDLPEETGIMFLSRYRESIPWQRRILLCPPMDSDLAVFMINEAQIFRCVTLPLEPAQFVQSVEVALNESTHIERLVNAGTENEKLREQLLHPPYAISPAQRFSKGWVRAMPRMIVVILLTFVGVLVLGTITLLSLYFLKTVLGIDLVPGAHLSDALG